MRLVNRLLGRGAMFNAFMAIWPPFNSLLSRLFGGTVPHGVAMTLEAAASRSSGAYMAVLQEQSFDYPPAEGVPPGHPAFGPVHDQMARQAVAELPGGRVLGQHRAVISGRDELVQEVSWVFGNPSDKPLRHPVYIRPRHDPPLDVAGRLGVLASRGDTNYFHFMFDVLPRLAIIEQADHLKPVDSWYVPTSQLWQRDLLTLAADIPPDQVIDSDTHRHVKADMLVVPSVPSSWPAWIPPQVVTWLRERLLPQPEQVPLGPPVYVTRSSPGISRRQVLNDDAVLDVLEARGFHAVDPGQLSVAEQIETFAEAPIVVGPHGAALSNLVFARPGAVIVELFPDWANLPDCFRRVAAAIPHVRYRYLAGTEQRPSPTFFPSQADDLSVDITALSRLLDDLIAEDVSDTHP